MTTTIFPGPLKAKEEEEVIQEAFLGNEEAKQTLIKHNMRLVAYIANRYRNLRTETEDLVSIGTIGLIKAVNTFDPTKKNKFATYASRCIQNEILMDNRKAKKSNSELFLEDSIKSDEDGNDLSMLDIVGTEKEEVENEIEFNDTVGIIRNILNTLDVQEREIIQYRFGIDCEKKRQTEIARHFNISQSYVSRIERRVLKKIKMQYEKMVAV